LRCFLPQTNFPFQASPKKSSMASNTKSWNKIPKPDAKTERQQEGEERARARGLGFHIGIWVLRRRFRPNCERRSRAREYMDYGFI
jgi:hypothetical protein